MANYSIEVAYQITVSTRIVAGTLAGSSSLFCYSFFPSYQCIVSDGIRRVAKNSFMLDHVLGYIYIE